MDASIPDSPRTHNVSRRSFIELAVSTISVLPAVAGGFLLPDANTIALADEDDSSAALQNGQTSRIVVVSPKQVGLYVADQADDSNKAVADAHVRIVSRFNGNVADGFTDEDGCVVFDIEELAEGRDEMGLYSFNGTIEVYAPGYREFCMALTRITGGVGISVPTRNLESEACPYPSKVSFEEWDALYTKNTFVSTSANDGDKMIEVTIKELFEPATLTLRDRGSDTVYASAALSPNETGTANATLSGEFLRTDASSALPPDGDYYMQFETSSTEYTFPLALKVQKGITEKLTIAPEQDLSPTNTSVPSGPSIKAPDYIPVIGGESLSVWIPSWYITPVVDPFGFLYVSFQTPRIGYTNDSGTTNPGKWGVHPYANASTQWNNYTEANLTKTDNVFNALTKGSNASHVKWSSVITAAASLRFVLSAKWDWDKGSFQGNAEALGLLEFNVNCTEQFTLGPVPMFINFGFNSSVQIQFMGIGVATTDALDFSKYDWDYTNTGTTLTINFSPFLSVGVGISGVASIALKGTCTLTFFVGLWGPTPPGAENPHTIFGATGRATVEVQLFLFTWSAEFWSFNEPKIHDSWMDSSSLQAGTHEGPSIPGDYLLKDGGYSYSVGAGQVAEVRENIWHSLMNESTPVTEDDLAQTAEVKVASGALLGAIYNRENAEEFEDEDGRTALLLPWDARLMSGEDSEPAFTQTALATPLEGAETAGVDHVDEKLGGVWPTFDMKLMANIYSDPRMKVVTTRDSVTGSDLSYAFRIASAEVDGRMRSRVVWQIPYTSTITIPYAVEFETGIDGVPRSELYDYDFDVVSNPEGTDVYLFIISGMRSSDAVTPYEAFENLVFTYLRFDVSNGTIGSRQCTQQSFSWRTADGRSIEGVSNAFICPNITYLSGAGADSFLMFSWLHRYTDHPDKDISTPDAGVSIGAGFAYGRGIVLPNVEGRLVLRQDTSAYDLVAARGDTLASGRIFVEFVVHCQKGTTCAHMEVVPPTDDETVKTRNESVHGLLTTRTSRFTPWLGHTGFLTCYEGRLVQAEVRDDTSTPWFFDVGLGKFEVDSFGIDGTGTYVYFPQGRAGVGEIAYDNDGNPTTTDVYEFNIVAAKLHNGVFSDPFILAHVNHSMESIAYIYANDKSMAFLSASITDFSTSTADLYLTRVPSVVCPTLLGAEPVIPLVAAGDDAEFMLTIRNDGNIYLSGATVRFLDGGGDLIDSCYLSFGQDTLQGSIWNPPEELSEDEQVLIAPMLSTQEADGLSLQALEPQDLLNVGADYELTPGRKAVYKVVLPIPRNWRGEKFISIELADPDYVRSEGLLMDENPVILEGVSFAKEGNLQLTVSGDADVDHNINQDAPVSVRKKGGEPTPEPEPEPGPGPKPEPTPTPKPEPTPATGDASELGAAALLAAAGAGMVAYSARRTALEQEGTDE